MRHNKLLYNYIKNEKGNVFILTAIFLVVLLGVMVFVVDVGSLYLNRRQVVNAADAAAMAGAQEIVRALNDGETEDYDVRKRVEKVVDDYLGYHGAKRLEVTEQDGSDIGADSKTVKVTADKEADLYFVPAFSGLYAPYWDSSARGTIVGLTGYVKSGHLARAVLEATAYQTKDIVDAMEKDSSIPIQELRVDGGMSQSDILMQYQADILQVPVIKPRNQETTALGAAYAAGLSQGFWGTLDDVADHWKEGRRWETSMEPSERDRQVRKWHRAVDRAKQWETKQQE